MNRKYLLVKDRVDLRDMVYRSTSVTSPDQLLSSVDLRSACSPIVDQGQQGSCTANAIGPGLLEFLQLKKTNSFTPMSRAFIYYEERKIEGTVNEDAGAMIADGMKVVNQLGCAPDADMPYRDSDFKTAPTQKALTDAEPYKVAEYHRITSTLLLKAALCEGLPVVIGTTLYESFESEAVASTGKVPSPKRGERVLGGHAMFVVGYKKIGRSVYFIVRNSWGEGWGDKGYCYMSESYFKKYVSDMWTATLPQ